MQGSNGRFADIQKGTGSWQAYFNKINAKHIDFVLCDLQNVRPVLAIELDDSSHNKPDRIQRDEFVNKVFADAKFPLLRVPVQRSCEKGTLVEKIRAHLHMYE